MIPTVQALPELFSSVNHQLGELVISGSAGALPVTPVDELLSGFRQFLVIVERLDAGDELESGSLTLAEYTDLGDYGISLLHQLMYIAQQHQQQDAVKTLGEIGLGAADWIMSQGGQLSVLEPLVDALAAKANTTSNPDELEALSDFMARISAACVDSLRYDLDLGNPGRPWRLLQINRGITATRSHRPELMQPVFDDLVVAIPHDAPGFFSEGMLEMDKLDYPAHVRNVMQTYYERYSHPRGH